MPNQENNHLHLIRHVVLKGYVEMVSSLGGDPISLLFESHIDPTLLSENDHYLPIDAVILLLESTAVKLNKPDFGLMLGRSQSQTPRGPIDILIASKPTISASLNAILCFIQNYSSALHIDVLPHSKGLLCNVTISSSEKANSQFISLELSMIYGVYSKLTGINQGPEEVHFPFSEPSHSELMAGYFPESTLVFDSEICGFLLNFSFLSHEIKQADKSRSKSIENYLKNKIMKDISFIEYVKSVIADLVPLGEATLPMVAGALAVKERTLQRKLRSHKVTFQVLLKMEKLAQSKMLLTSGKSAKEVAILLGYSEQSAFARAFKTENGLSPKQWLSLQNNS